MNEEIRQQKSPGQRMMRNNKKTQKTENVIRLSWFEECYYKVIYFGRKDSSELFDELIRLNRKHIDYSIKVKREDKN